MMLIVLLIAEDDKHRTEDVERFVHHLDYPGLTTLIGDQTQSSACRSLRETIPHGPAAERLYLVFGCPIDFPVQVTFVEATSEHLETDFRVELIVDCKLSVDDYECWCIRRLHDTLVFHKKESAEYLKTS